MRKLRAYFRLLRGKIVRDKLSPNRVAAGWALGMFCGCAIPFGFQLIISIPVAIFAKVSKVGATLGTFITNPVTIFLIYPAQTWAVYHVLFGGSPKLPDKWSFEAVSNLAGSTILSFLLGGFILAVILSPITFFVVRRIVVFHRSGGIRRVVAEHRKGLSP